MKNQEPSKDCQLSSADLFSILKRFDHYINLANQKASIQLGAIVLIFATYVASSNTIISNTSVTWCPKLSLYLSLLGIACAAINIAFNLLTIFPDVKTGDVHGKYTSLIAYGSIAKMKPDDFQNMIKSRDYDFCGDLILQIHRLASICDTKFKHQSWATRWFVVVIFAMMAMTVLGITK